MIFFSHIFKRKVAFLGLPWSSRLLAQPLRGRKNILPFWALYVGIPIGNEVWGLKLEVRGPRKNCVHFWDQNLEMTQLTSPMRPNGQKQPICRDPATPKKFHNRWQIVFLGPWYRDQYREGWASSWPGVGAVNDPYRVKSWQQGAVHTTRGQILRKGSRE